MKNLVQIICGCSAAETIEECARVPVSLGAEVIVVHGIWPRIDHPTDEPSKYGDSSAWISPQHHIDNVQAIAAVKGWHFIQMQDYAYNGTQYNIALEYIALNAIPCDYIWFVDSDECIDPAQTNTLLAEVELFRSKGVHSVRFHKRLEIVPDWKAFSYDITGGNYGIVMGDALTLRRKTHFDGNFHFETPIPFGITSVPLLHLHHFRKNAAKRITDGIWNGGGLFVEVAKAPDLYDSAYTRHLKARYSEFHVDAGEFSSYLGSALFKS